MPYQVYYPSGCEAEIGDHYCNPCDEPEGGRVRGIAFIASDFAFTDPSSTTEWRNGILAKQIIIIPETNGTFDGGAEVEGPGYGDQATKLTGYNFSLTYNDPNYKLNADFYNALKRSRNWKLAYKTESLVHLTQNTVSVVPKNPVTDDISSEVVWNVLVKWSEGDLPIPYDEPASIFTCFDYTGVITA
jgi:hypothetical protein